ncbi:Bug family tripartite tricarboxylate transporter substrate binding protein [Billgrantia aerodenitrificans]|uniref:Tricarboxylate transporter n=1 Tax=Billgrantia aerodenitrificans TaxID=2733483 RepID=A0ABS9ANK2_9GAMM|nr:tricarboxylate transporter [Halomonas aerodenitrificans]MCE8023212.1 tricarboxylate transporter [Halomonas aerodenitrificans]
MKRTIYAFSTSLLLVAGFGPAPQALSSDVDFSGERIEWLVPFREGGGTDTWARFFAPRLSEALPGQPTLIIRNVPGGGSINGANQFDTRGKNNGQEIFGSTASTLFYAMLGDRRASYQPQDWVPVFATPTGGVLYLSSDLGIDSAAELAELGKQELIFPSLGPTSLDLVPLLAMEMLHLNVRPVFGMDRSAGRLAFERGEVNVDYQTSAPYLKNVTPLVEEGSAVPIMSWGVLGEDGSLQRDPSFPDLPHFAEVYEMIHGEAPQGQAFEVWKTFFIAGFAAQKMLFLQEGTPQEIVDTYRKAAIDISAQPDFQEQASVAIGDYDQILGDNVDTAFEMIFSLSEDDTQWIQNWLAENYDVKF